MTVLNHHQLHSTHVYKRFPASSFGGAGLKGAKHRGVLPVLCSTNKAEYGKEASHTADINTSNSLSNSRMGENQMNL